MNIVVSSFLLATISVSLTTSTDSEDAVATKNQELRKRILSCDTCRSPKFQGKDFYLPFCSPDGETSYNTICEAVCDLDPEAAEAGLVPSKGSCDKCEVKKCGQVFLPVCSEDGKTLYANKCHANCAGAAYKECSGVMTIIPGRSPLPPNAALPVRLQNFEDNDADPDSDIA